MVAELTLFLSSDEMLQARASKTKNGTMIYCVRDFIRVVADKINMKPSSAMLYWMSAVCSRELRAEHTIQDQYNIMFLSAYETKNVCITGTGLQLLFNYLDHRFPGFVRPNSKEELRQRLAVLADGGGAEYVWEYDDGEVEEMMAVKEAANAEGRGLECPPDDWPYFFDDATVDTTTTTTPQQPKEAVVVEQSIICPVAKKDRQTAFSIRDLIEEFELEIDHTHMPALCKAVCTRFRELRPGSDVFTKMRRTFFYQQDRACMEGILREEYMKYVMRGAGREFEIQTVRI